MTKHTILKQDYTYNRKTYKAGSRVVVHSVAASYAEVTLFDAKGSSVQTTIKTDYLNL